MLKSLDRFDHSVHNDPIGFKLSNPSSPTSTLLRSPTNIDHQSPTSTPDLNPSHPHHLNLNHHQQQQHRHHPSYPASSLNHPKSIPQSNHPSPTHPLSHHPHRPRHDSKDSKPRKSSSSPPIRIPIEPGHCLVFGRKPDLSLVTNEITPKSTLLPITLPKSFTHASRTHCLCTLIAPPLGGLNIRIVVKGQNGLMVDGERFEEGSSAGVELERRDGEQIELGFYGGKKVECYVKIDDHSLQRVRARPNAHLTKKNLNLDRAKLSTTTASARGGKRKLNSDRSNLRSSIPKNVKSNSKLNLPLSPLDHPDDSISPSNDSSHHHPPSDPSSSLPLPPPPPPDTPISPRPSKKLCLSPILPLTFDPQIHDLPPGERVQGVIQSMGLDLVGLIASAIVFFPRATVSTTEVVRAVLETQPSLAEAVLALLPIPSSSRSSPRPINRQQDDLFGSDSKFQLKKERECLSAPLPSMGSNQDDPIDTKPFLHDLKPSPHHYGSEGGGIGIGSPALDFSPGDLKTDRVVNACRSIMLETLQNNWRLDGTGMFGCVTNEGLKDASGEPLEALWYYQPQHDSDKERRLNLQPYVRHVRHTQTTSKQYFFKKVRGSGRRKA